MNEIGFTSYNQLTKYQVWKKQGYLNSGTNINDQINILNKRSEMF